MKPRLLLTLLFIPLTALALAVACGGDDKNDNGGSTPEPAPATAVPPTVAASPTTGPDIDGTVAPQNAGDVIPVTIKSNPDPLPTAPAGIITLKDVRVGDHPENGGWNRIVFEFDGPLRPPGLVSYQNAVTDCGRGDPVTLKGKAILVVRFDATRAHTDAGQPTIKANTIDGPGKSILESKQICDFEAVVAWAIGTSDRKNFKVTLLDNPTRVVIDVKN